MNRLAVLLVFLFAPIIAIYGVVFGLGDGLSMEETLQVAWDRPAVGSLHSVLPPTQFATGDFISIVDALNESAEKDRGEVEARRFQVSLLQERVTEQSAFAADIYEQHIVRMLGEAIEVWESKKWAIQIYPLEELGYRGYVAKVRLLDPETFRVVLAEDQVGGLETVRSMAERTGAVFAINGGGFGIEYRGSNAISHMIGVTVVDSVVVKSFVPNGESLFFAGINQKGDVIGQVLGATEDVIKMKAKEGVSFLPVLLKKGEKRVIPSAWAKARHPRTVFGKYANGDLLFMVIDGRQGSYSKGVTLERLQDKLLELGVRDAYNYDGGGSSTFYFNGKVYNRPSDGFERPVANGIVIVP